MCVAGGKEPAAVDRALGISFKGRELSAITDRDLLQDQEGVVQLLPWHGGCLSQVLRQCLPFVVAAVILGPCFHRWGLQSVGPGVEHWHVQPTVGWAGFVLGWPVGDPRGPGVVLWCLWFCPVSGGGWLGWQSRGCAGLDVDAVYASPPPFPPLQVEDQCSLAMVGALWWFRDLLEQVVLWCDTGVAPQTNPFRIIQASSAPRLVSVCMCRVKQDEPVATQRQNACGWCRWPIVCRFWAGVAGRLRDQDFVLGAQLLEVGLGAWAPRSAACCCGPGGLPRKSSETRGGKVAT